MILQNASSYCDSSQYGQCAAVTDCHMLPHNVFLHSMKRLFAVQLHGMAESDVAGCRMREASEGKADDMKCELANLLIASLVGGACTHCFFIMLFFRI